MRAFNNWLESFKENIATYNYFTDFAKVYRNVADIKIELNILNSLIGSNNIENDFRNIINNYPEVLKVIPILIAKRENKIKVNEGAQSIEFNFKNKFNQTNDYVKFMNETGLFELISKRLINNLFDYVMGIEVGMDTNARKNRTGKTMESLVEGFIISKGYIKNNNYFVQMSSSEIESRFKLNLETLTNKGKNKKVFDFVIFNQGNVYAIEVNFYNSQGSKLNETARSYKQLSQESKKIDNFEFLWITDGLGWYSAKTNLEETFDAMSNNIANINDLENNFFDKYLNIK